MKTISCLFTSAVVFSLCFVSLASAVPSTHTVFGFAFLDGDPVPIGSIITAKDINGTELASSTVMTDDGLYGFLDIPGDNPDTPEDEGAVNGEIISFYLEDIESNQTLVWYVDETGMNYTELNLTFINVTEEGPTCGIETYAINIETDAAYYLPNSTVSISGMVLNSTCEPVSNETVLIEVKYENETVFLNETITNETGQFLTLYNLDENASEGYYTVYAYYQNVTNETGFPVVLCDDCDNDGFIFLDDCDDNDPNTYPGAPEICDGKDNDCDEQIDEGGVCESTGGETETYTPSGGGGGVSTTSYCMPNWNCTDWSTCSEDGIQTRVCVDLNNCGTNLNKPEETKACVYVSEEKERIICNANTTVCAGNNVMKCEEGKRWVFVEKCSVVCKNGKCISALELNASAEKINETEVTGFVLARPLEIFGTILIILLIVGTLVFWKLGKI